MESAAETKATELALKEAAAKERSVINKFYNIVDQYEKVLRVNGEELASSIGLLRDKMITVNNIITNSSKNLFVKSAQTTARWNLELAAFVQNQAAIDATASFWRNAVLQGLGSAVAILQLRQ